MAWEVEFTDEFEAWWGLLFEEEQDAVAHHVGLLGRMGPQLPFPYSSGISGSKHPHMRELRVQYQGKPYRVPYAFDPHRTVILLIGGCKVGKGQWYREYVPIADRLYDEHLTILEQEDSGNGKKIP